jgi:hypothetical protein
MPDVIVEKYEINFRALHEELAAALGAVFTGMSTGRSGVTVHLTDRAAAEDSITAVRIVQLHDPLALTGEQEAFATDEAEIERLRIDYARFEAPKDFGVPGELLYRLAEQVYYLRAEVDWLRRFIKETRPL